MLCGDNLCIWRSPNWPSWHYDLTVLAEPLAKASRAQGLLMGRLTDVGQGLRDKAGLAAQTDDVLTTSEIEGEYLNIASVRSSIARRLGALIERCTMRNESRLFGVMRNVLRERYGETS